MIHHRSLHRNNTVVRGDGQHTLVLAHGFGCDQNMWSRLEPYLEGFRLVLFDHTGSGKSDLTAFDPARHGRLEGYAEDLGEICDALDLRGATLVGHSVSSTIGLIAAVDAPGRFANLVMICPSPCFLNLPGYAGGFERSDLQELIDLMDRNYIGWAHHLAPLVTGQPANSPLSEELAQSFCSTDPLTAKAFAEATFLSDHRDILSQAMHQVLVLQSARDALAALSVGRYVSDQLPCSQLEVIDAEGHCLHMTHPAEVGRFIRSFVNG